LAVLGAPAEIKVPFFTCVAAGTRQQLGWRRVPPAERGLEEDDDYDDDDDEDDCRSDSGDDSGDDSNSEASSDYDTYGYGRPWQRRGHAGSLGTGGPRHHPARRDAGLVLYGTMTTWLVGRTFKGQRKVLGVTIPGGQQLYLHREEVAGYDSIVVYMDTQRTMQLGNLAAGCLPLVRHALGATSGIKVEVQADGVDSSQYHRKLKLDMFGPSAGPLLEAFKTQLSGESSNWGRRTTGGIPAPVWEPGAILSDAGRGARQGGKRRARVAGAGEEEDEGMQA
jgi:hypothetical protein